MRVIPLLAISTILAQGAEAEIKWSGSAGVRHLIVKRNDGLEAKNNVFENKDISKSTNRRWEFRGTIGMLASMENIDFGLDLRTNSSQTSEWLQANNATDLAFSLGQAFGRVKFKPFESDLGVTVGRAKTVLLYDNMAQMLFDNDTRWDGLGWSWKMGMFGLNATQYILGSQNNGTGASASSFTYTQSSQETGDTKSRFGVLYAFQPHVNFTIAEDISSIFAVSYLSWTNTQGNATTGWFSNNVHGGVANSTAGTAVGNTTAVSLDNARQWHFLSDTALPFKLRFVAEYVMNKKVLYGARNQAATGAATPVEANNKALALSLGWGKPKKAGEFGFTYSFSRKGIASVVGTFTNGDIAPDNLSHLFEGRFMLADGLGIGAKAQFHKEMAKLGGDGQPLAAPNNKRETTQQRYEIVSALSF
jgi:hypothetical protein